MNNDNKTVSQNRQKKEEIVAEFVDKADRAKSLIFTNYQGLTHHQLETIKHALRKLNAEFVITKNRLLLRALDKHQLSDEHKAQMQQPTATLFAYEDIIEPLKILAQTIKELNLPTIKFALVEGKIVTPEDVIKLSTLPPMPVLRAQLLGQMLSPVQSLHHALNWNIQKLVMTLKAIESNKQTATST